MSSIIKLTVLFENPFWIGIFEVYDSEYRVCKVVFGPEPKETEIFEFLLTKFNNLRFSNGIRSESKEKTRTKNPKRIQRELKKASLSEGIGTKAQNALKEEFKKLKIINKQRKKDRKEEEQERKFQLKKKKRIEKHKGH